MKQISNYIQEAFKVGSKTKISKHIYYPKDREELEMIIRTRLKEDRNADLNDIDVSKITDMFNLFNELDPHNIDISDWNVSNVTDMGHMFSMCKNFNCDLSKWNVSNVEYMEGMFKSCSNFNCDLSKWNVSNVKQMRRMFKNCPLEKNPPKWYKEK